MKAGWRVLVADDHAITRLAIIEWLRSCPEVKKITSWVASDREWTILDTFKPDLLLVDLRSPGLAVVGMARGRLPELRVVVLSGYDEPDHAWAALAEGADGFLVRGMSPESMLGCMKCVMKTGMVVVSPALRAAMGAPLPSKGERAQQASPPQPAGTNTAGGKWAIVADPEVARVLTPREREIYVLLGRNLSNKEIARQLFIAEPTVKAHVSRILAKLGEPNRAQAVIHGMRHVLLDPSRSDDEGSDST